MTRTRSICLDGPTDEVRTSLVEFFRNTGAPIGWTDSPDEADVIIDWPDEREICEPDKLHAGGRIACADAFKAAGKLRMDRNDIGSLMNLLEIRITSCQLGCFK